MDVHTAGLAVHGRPFAVYGHDEHDDHDEHDEHDDHDEHDEHDDHLTVASGTSLSHVICLAPRLILSSRHALPRELVVAPGAESISP